MESCTCVDLFKRTGVQSFLNHMHVLPLINPVPVLTQLIQLIPSHLSFSETAAALWSWLCINWLAAMQICAKNTWWNNQFEHVVVWFVWCSSDQW